MPLAERIKAWARRIKRDALLLPAQVVEDSRAKADDWMASQGSKPTSRAGAVLIVAVWVGLAVLAWWWWHSR